MSLIHYYFHTLHHISWPPYVCIYQTRTFVSVLYNIMVFEGTCAVGNRYSRQPSRWATKISL